MLLGLAAPGRAQAHGPVDPAASRYLARVDAVPAGVRVRVVDGDLRLWMHVAPGRTVTVLDYQGAPYVRFTPTGVEINANSAMFYLNQRPPEIPPTDLDAHTPPRWFRAGGGASFEWHDGRLHALAATLAAPGTRVLGRWTIPLRVDGRRTAVAGTLDQAPPPSAGWWWPIVVALLGLPALLRLRDLALDRRLARGLSWLALLAFLLASVASGLHGRPGLARTRVGELVLEVAFAGWAAWSLARRRRETAVFLLVAAGAFYRGIAAVTVLWRGWVLLALPPALARGAVSTCLACGVDLVLLVFVLSAPERPRRMAETSPPLEAEPRPTMERSPVA